MKEFFSEVERSIEDSREQEAYDLQDQMDVWAQLCAPGKAQQSCTPQELFARGEWKELARRQIVAAIKAGRYRV